MVNNFMMQKRKTNTPTKENDMNYVAQRNSKLQKITTSEYTMCFGTV